MKKRIRASYAAVFLWAVGLLMLSPAWSEVTAQTGGITVSGVVTDVSGETLVGVNVSEKGTTTGTITDINGKYSVTVSGRTAVLAFSYIGYVTQEATVGGNTILNARLQEDTHNLDEVIVVGYGTLKKSDLTGAVARVTMDDKAAIPNVNLAQALSGASAGVNLTQTGLAGGEAKLSIRGKTSLSANDDPLIVLDGIIYNGSISDINVNDIEYIDILKDASATAVYGSRSANGVVIISTKKGKTGKPKVSFNSYFGVQGYTSSPMKVMNAEQYALRLTDYYYQQDLYAWYKTHPSTNVGKPAYPNTSDRQTVAGRLRSQEEKDMYLEGGHDIDWVDVVSRDNPTIQGYDANFSGSTDRVNYYASASYAREEGVMENDQFNRYTFNTKVDGKLTNWLSVGLNVNYSYRDYSGLEAKLADARTASPLAKVADPYDLVNSPIFLTGENYMPYPLARTRADNEDIRTTLFYVANAKVDIPFVKGLTYDFNYSNTSYNRKNNVFHPATIPDGYATKGKAERTPEESTSWIFNNIVTYLNKFGDHSINATLLYSRERYSGGKFLLRSEYFENDALGYNNMALGTKITTSDNQAWEEMGVSYMGRANYQFKNRYMAAATVRRDGFSGFGADSKFVTLPSFSLGWIASEEDFMQELDWLYAKLRLSYGQNGNQGIGRYSSFAKMKTESYVYGSSSVVAVYPESIANPSLAWEKTSSYNIGFDFGFLDRRINTSIDLYTAQTNDVLVKRRLPWAAGYENIWTNIGGISNKGIDIEVSSTNLKLPDFTWDMGVVFSLNRDKITKLYGGENDKDVGNSWFVGEPISAVYDYKVIGMWQEEDLYNGTIYEGWYPGQFKYEDLNKDGKITADDRSVIGYKTPNYSFSISNTLKYKNWSLYFLINSIQGGNGYNLFNSYTYTNVSERSDDVYRVNQTSSRPYWTPENRQSGSTGIYNSPAITGGYWENRGFVRLQDVSLTYNFSPKVLKTLGNMSYLQLYLSGKNLYTWTKFSGWDPEYASLSSDIDDQRGIRNVVFGIKLSL
ncbi:Outer membrane cobalamin receptor protein, SusC/RagA family [Bacteroidales bacterium Barb6XT]|nr:Outer membrane cobalamin receptor protein, SusC/RagA family [Bacteroidales bacterium Barb6XT]